MQSKRLITIILVVVLTLFGTLAASAANANDTLEVAVSTSPVTDGLCVVAPGETVTAVISVGNNPGFHFGQFIVEFDSEFLTYESGKVVGDFANIYNQITTPADGQIYVSFFDDTTLIEATGAVVEFTFKVSDTVTCGETFIELAQVDKSFSNFDTGAMLPVSVAEGNGGTVFFHTYVKNDAKSTPATCEDDEVIVYDCACGSTFETVGQTALGHTGDVSYSDPDCQNNSIKTIHCSRCGETATEEIYGTKTDHSYNSTVVAPTCENNGYTDNVCSVCGYSYVSDTVAALGHSYAKKVVDPTCNEKGYTEHTCSTCGDYKVDTYVDAKGHTYAETKVDATCTTMGSVTYTCACGDKYVTYVDAKGHTYTAAKTDATCTTMGYTTYTCACGDKYVADYVDALGHTYTAVKTDATCTTMGYTTYTCTCGDKYVADYVDALGHTEEVIPAVEPTVTKDGSTAGRKCSVCDAVIDATNVIPDTNLAWLWVLITVFVVVGGAATGAFILWKKELWIFKK